jgi:hypothetical protein
MDRTTHTTPTAFRCREEAEISAMDEEAAIPGICASAWPDSQTLAVSPLYAFGTEPPTGLVALTDGATVCRSMGWSVGENPAGLHTPVMFVGAG